MKLSIVERIFEAIRSAPLESKEMVWWTIVSQYGTQTLLRDKVWPMVDRVIYHPMNQGKRADLRSG